MGKIKEGITGPFSGKVGPVVGATWRGVPVMRGLPKKRTKPYTPKELQQQAKFALMNSFLGPVIPLVHQTFIPATRKQTGYNLAFSYNVKNAITGVHPDLKIDFSMVLLGRGDLPNANSPTVSSSSPGKLDFSWTDNSGKGIALPTDKAYVAVYHEELNQWIHALDLAPRSAGACTIDVSIFIGKPLQTWIGFISSDKKNVSDTVWTRLISL